MDNEQALPAVGRIAALKESTSAKVGAYVLLVLFTCMAALSIIGICLALADNYYTRRPEELKEELLGSFVWDDAHEICTDIALNGTSGYKVSDTLGSTNVSCRIIESGRLVYDDHNTKQPFYYYSSEFTIWDSSSDTDYTAELYINKNFPVRDKYSFTASAVDVLYALRGWIYVIALFSLGACLGLFIFLMQAAGHKKGQSGFSGSFVTKIPFDLLLAAAILAGYLLFSGLYELSYTAGSFVMAIGLSAVLAICYCLLLGLCISLSARIKMGTWWKNNLTAMVLRLILSEIKAIGRAVAAAIAWLPLIWKTVLGLIILGILGLCCIMFDDGASRLTMLFFVGLALAAGVIYLAITLRKLQAAGRKIAGGDLSYRVDTSKMLWDFKEHGDNLNSISLGMTKAVDERMKSERLKTELITNVSHDLKTPLTSIINYVDLISKEKSGNQKIDEYTAVLARQSERLKKLVEDLVEASKASTGSIDVALAPCDAGVLVSQTAGEYEERMRSCALEPVVTAPQSPLMIMADGRLLWRVFDNLISNVCKYAQPDTRVYIGAEQTDGEVVISVKNISKYPLNIRADELLERFVRGDSSRSTEGSGLGLSIAKSLTELMGGRFSLTIDGDLFKAALHFGIIS